MRRFLQGILIVSVILVAAVTALFVSQLQPRQLSEQGILVCTDPLEEPVYMRATATADYEAFDSRFKQYVAAGETAEMQLLNIALQPGTLTRSSLDEYLAIAGAYPDDALAALYALRACVSFPDRPGCDDRLIANTLAMNSDNAVAHSLVAGLRHRQGDELGAVSALQSAVTAPDYDDNYLYFLGTTNDHVRTIATDLDTPIHYSAFTVASILLLNNYPATGSVQEMCSSRTADNPVLARACFDYADRMERDTTVYIGRMQAYALRQATFLGVGNQSEYDRLEREYRNFNFSEAPNRQASALMTHDDSLFQFWNEVLLESGEFAARDRLLEEALRRSSDADYNVCPDIALANTIFLIKDFTHWLLTESLQGTQLATQ